MAKAQDRLFAGIVGMGLAIIATFFVLTAARLFLGGPEDTWICRSGTWVRHGSPSAAMPTTPCR